MTVPPSRSDVSSWSRISVVTPSFNQGEYIEETIRSVLLQGYPDLEYIIVDGGSTDETISILRRYEPWLAYWVSEPDRGQSHAINKGWARATGAWLGWLNSDDIYLPSALRTAMESAAADKGRDLIYGDVQYVNADGSHRMVRRARPFDLRAHVLAGGVIHTPAVFWQSHLIAKAGPLDEGLQYGMDNDFWLRVMPHARGYYCRKVLGTFRRHHDSKTVQAQMSLVRETHQAFLRALVQDPYKSLLNEAEKRHVLGRSVWMMGVLAHRSGQSAVAERCFQEAIVTYRLLEMPDVPAHLMVRDLLEDKVVEPAQIEAMLSALPISRRQKAAFSALVWDHYQQVRFYGGFAQGIPRQVVRSILPMVVSSPARIVDRGFWAISARSLAMYLRQMVYAS